METNFKIGDWVYYLGGESGGYDTGVGYWMKGVIGQVLSIGSNLGIHNVINKDSQMRNSNCSNDIRAFRLATPNEISQTEETYYEIY